LWDKDKQNKLTEGDYLAFITGPNDAMLVQIFLVSAELPPSARPTEWASDAPHTEGNGVTAVDDRGVVQLTNVHQLPLTIEWWEYRQYLANAGFSPGYKAPRATQRVVCLSQAVNAFEFPFGRRIAGLD
jgi:hypothetical protein